MTLRDMNRGELDLFEEEIVQTRDEPTPRRVPNTPEVGREEDLDRDGLPDGPAEDRVPS
jgi:hypothetical protein